MLKTLMEIEVQHRKLNLFKFDLVILVAFSSVG